MKYLSKKYALKVKCNADLAVNSVAVFQNTQTRHLRVWKRRNHAALGSLRPATGRSGNLAGVEGFEPANAGIKIQCLNQLGDTPTQDNCCCQQPTYNRCLLIAFQEAGSLPTCQGMHLQISAFANQPVATSVCQVGIFKNLCKYSTSRAGHAS